MHCQCRMPRRKQKKNTSNKSHRNTTAEMCSILRFHATHAILASEEVLMVSWFVSKWHWRRSHKMHIHSVWHRHYVYRRRRVGHFTNGFHCYCFETHSVISRHRILPIDRYKIQNTNVMIIINDARITIKSYENASISFPYHVLSYLMSAQFVKLRRSNPNRAPYQSFSFSLISYFIFISFSFSSRFIIAQPNFK